MIVSWCITGKVVRNKNAKYIMLKCFCMITFNIICDCIILCRFKLATRLLKDAGNSVALRLLVLPHLKFNDVNDGGSFESADTTPYVIHNAKSGVRQQWCLREGDVVLLAAECFEEVTLFDGERIWGCVLSACADCWLRHCGKGAGERRSWLSRNLRNLHDAVVAAEQGVKLDWLSRCEEWKWSWCGEHES